MRQLSQIYLLLLLIAPITGCSTVSYYSQAISGHLSIMLRKQPNTELIANANTPPELRRQLLFAEQARTFARHELALPVGGAFSEYVSLGRPWVVVNLVAVPEFSLSPHQWCYPVIGCQAYRGYFSLNEAREEQAGFQEQGFDTMIGTVTAYSTLGWFDDPLHTGFTALPDDRMVALMFHELAHRVIYIKGDTAFNESFATAVELEGLRLWLQRTGSEEGFTQALKRLQYREQTLTLVIHTSQKLHHLYEQQESLGTPTLRARKKQLFDELADAYAGLAEQYSAPGPLGSPPVRLNNAHLALFRQYNQHVPAFRQLLKESGYDFGEFYRVTKALAGQSTTSRDAQLQTLSERFVEYL
ncbi:aminopeptidase [Marinobacter daepoensis]|uniref:aminopeptidase n=1 Tax=Marinobacter daepoensis TaxID=262077 RepID=UPI001C9879B5|nr:aminopeptidase [Marinobacter daepoensis]MBY6033811.1 aminopeptidase [Marinobacter daepoensis]